MSNKMKGDNLFDSKITLLDVIKILLLIVTMFSTWNIISIMTPDSPVAWVRIMAAVGVVEGAFLGFEFATSAAKNQKQTQYATIGFFCSLGVIAVFAGVSGFLEFAGPSMLDSTIGEWMGLVWTARNAVEIFALGTVVSWIVTLASLYRLYALADPDKQAELIKISLSGDVTNTANEALRQALDLAKPRIAVERALVQIEKDFKDELQPQQMNELKRDVKAHLLHHYGLDNAPAPAQISADPISIARMPSSLTPTLTPVPVAVRSNGNGNGHHSNDTNFPG